jgi:hypothetical protein
VEECDLHGGCPKGKCPNGVEKLFMKITVVSVPSDHEGPSPDIYSLLHRRAT